MKSFFAYAAMAAIAVAADGDTITTMDECFQQINGMTWDWANNVCITYEKNCVENQGGIWQEGAWGSMTCYMGTPAEDCAIEKKFWDWVSEKCYETWEELAIIQNAREAAECEADGYEWRTMREGDTQMFCYRDEPNQKCEIRGGFFDWVGEKCYDTIDERFVVEQQREEDRCVADGNEWRQGVEGHHWMVCYTGEPWEDCVFDGGLWNDNKCMTQQENEIYFCDLSGKTYDENLYGDGNGGCDFSSDVEEASEPVAASASLASKKSKAAASSNAGMYAGISFGVIGLVAAGAMFAAATKKQDSDNEFCRV